METGISDWLPFWDSSDLDGDYFYSKKSLCFISVIFTELLAENGSLSVETMSKIQAFVEKTNYTTWFRSAVWPPFLLLMLVILIQPFLLYLMDVCFEWFIDNNSYGSFCLDYNIQCLNVITCICLDART